MGNTVPSLLASAARMALLLVPVLALARLPGFRLTWVWYLSAATVWVQLAVSLALLRREFGRRLGDGAVRAGAPSAATPTATPERA